MKKRIFFMMLFFLGSLFIVSCKKSENNEKTNNESINEEDKNDDISEDAPIIKKELSYLLQDDDTYMVIGVGECLDNEIIIPSRYKGKKVSKIGNDAFKNCDYLTSVTIPNSVVIIGNSSFYGCSKLTNIIIPNGVTKIEDEAFAFCKNLLSVTINESVKEIGNKAFFECHRLVEIYNLSEINIQIGSSDLGYISKNAIIHKVIEESKLIKNDGFVFINNSNNYYLVSYPEDKKELTLPDDINGNTYGINEYAFYNDKNIIKVTLSNGVKGIDSNSFCGCYNLICIIISESVEAIKARAFIGCYKLVEVYNLSSLNITIGSDDFGYIGYYAKVIHKSLEKSNLIMKDDYLFLNDNSIYYLLSYLGSNKELILPNDINGKNYTINDRAFYNCIYIEKVIINGVIAIGKNAFDYCKNLKSVEILSNVTTIDEFAFYETGMTSIIIPKSIQIINQYSFTNNFNLKNVYYKGTLSDFENIKIEDYNYSLDYATIIYYSEDKPIDSINKYWHYVDDKIVIWE